MIITDAVVLAESVMFQVIDRGEKPQPGAKRYVVQCFLTEETVPLEDAIMGHHWSSAIPTPDEKAMFDGLKHLVVKEIKKKEDAAAKLKAKLESAKKIYGSEWVVNSTSNF